VVTTVAAEAAVAVAEAVPPAVAARPVAAAAGQTDARASIG
jgi:hypothetical protein